MVVEIQNLKFKTLVEDKGVEKYGKDKNFYEKEGEVYCVNLRV